MGRTQTVEGGLGRGVAAFDTGRLTLLLDDDFLRQAHHRLKEIVVDPHLVIQPVQSQGLGDSVETVVTHIGSYQGVVLLFDEAVVILVIRSAAGQRNALDLLLPEAQQVVIEELRAIALVLDGQVQGQGGVPAPGKADGSACGERHLP